MEKLGSLRELHHRRLVQYFLLPHKPHVRELGKRLQRAARRVFREEESDGPTHDMVKTNRTKKLNKCRLNHDILGKISHDTNYLMMLSCTPECPGEDNAGWKEVFSTLGS